MRFFLIAFNLKGVASLANICFAYDQFPSTTYVQKLVDDIRHFHAEIVIVNIFEFKNEEDYNNFNT